MHIKFSKREGQKWRGRGAELLESWSYCHSVNPSSCVALLSGWFGLILWIGMYQELEYNSIWEFIWRLHAPATHGASKLGFHLNLAKFNVIQTMRSQIATHRKDNGSCRAGHPVYPWPFHQRQHTTSNKLCGVSLSVLWQTIPPPKPALLPNVGIHPTC